MVITECKNIWLWVLELHSRYSRYRSASRRMNEETGCWFWESHSTVSKGEKFTPQTLPSMLVLSVTANVYESSPLSLVWGASFDLSGNESLKIKWKINPSYMMMFTWGLSSREEGWWLLFYSEYWVRARATVEGLN